MKKIVEICALLMIKVGIDIIEIERIKFAYENNGSRFLEKVFTKKEAEYAFSKVSPFSHLAARFSAKEAFIKAAGRSFNLNEIEVSISDGGVPEIVLFEKARDAAESLGVKDISCSLSHSRDYAVAVVMLMG